MEEQQQQQQQSEEAVSPPPPSYNSFFSSLSSLRASHNNSPNSSFGPTIAADRAEEFSRSWMARSLPRNMRRQIHEAAQAAAAANRESVIELPARMTSVTPESVTISVAERNDTQTSPPSPSQPQEESYAASSSTIGRMRRKIPKFFKTNTTTVT